MKITKLVLVRHGASKWNNENRFTGWCDVDLSEQGIIEARESGELLKEAGFIFDFAYTSMLKRAIHTLWNILDILDQSWLPVEKSWRLNERHYGDLQGLNKSETIVKYGQEQVKQWRRGFTNTPPKLSKENKQYSGYDFRYEKLSKTEIPLAESLAVTVNRVIPYWNNTVLPRLKNKERIIIVAHGNSLRALIKHIDNLSVSDLFDLEIPTGAPVIYEFNEQFTPVKRFYLKKSNIS